MKKKLTIPKQIMKEDVKPKGRRSSFNPVLKERDLRLHALEEGCHNSEYLEDPNDTKD